MTRYKVLFLTFLLLLILMASAYAQRSVQKASSKSLSVSQIIIPIKKEQTQKLFSAKSPWADSALKAMSLEEKVGQMLVAYSFSHYQSEDSEPLQKLSRLVQEGKIGGIMFSKGMVYELAMLANRYQSLAKYPLLISSDMEWGLAMRIDRTTEFPNNMGVAATWNPEYANEMGRTIAKEARALGIHQNYAPSVDLNNNPNNPIINTRAFSEDIGLTNVMAKAFIYGTQSSRMIATAKHFPGHGDTETDSHNDLPVLPFSRERLDTLELAPFKAAIANGVMSVMVAHLALPEINASETIPASLSPEIITSILRQDLEFSGLVVTDAMTMQGVQKHYGAGEAAVQAVLAGNDIILVPPDISLSHTEIIKAVQSGKIPASLIDNAARKILTVKEWLGIHRKRLVDLNSISSRVGTVQNESVAQEIADRSITLIRNEENVLPLKVKTTSSRKLLSVILQNSRSKLEGTDFYQALRSRFTTEQMRLSPESNRQNQTDVLKAARTASAIVVSCYIDVMISSNQFGLDANQTRLLKELTHVAEQRNIPIVVISFGSPYVIMGHSKVPAYLCAYSGAKVCETAVAKVLKGELDPQGRVP
ncbi:MAG: glycoside hydrolase family 3 protein, partial [Chlorobiales bacterium]|nr:glycoside hydrolase family 3 protein [Chlorobiales bacterium]